jgi:hypothetical protein
LGSRVLRVGLIRFHSSAILKIRERNAGRRCRGHRLEGARPGRLAGAADAEACGFERRPISTQARVESRGRFSEAPLP